MLYLVGKRHGELFFSTYPKGVLPAWVIRSLSYHGSFRQSLAGTGKPWIASTGTIDPLAKRTPRLTKPLIVVTHGDTWKGAKPRRRVVHRFIKVSNHPGSHESPAAHRWAFKPFHAPDTSIKKRSYFASAYAHMHIGDKSDDRDALEDLVETRVKNSEGGAAVALYLNRRLAP